MKLLIATAALIFSASAMAYQPPVYINQMGNVTTYSQGGHTAYCHHIGSTTICN